MSNNQKQEIMKFIVNPTTGQNEAQFTAKLLSVSTNKLANINGTEYRPASIEFVDVNGKKQTASCIVYEKNFSYGMEKDSSYLATASQTEKGVLITLSHLSGSADRPNEGMFGFTSVAKVEIASKAKLNA